VRGPAEVRDSLLETKERTLITAFEKYFALPDGSVPPRARQSWSVPVSTT
jgi:hypothetical protein